MKKIFSLFFVAAIPMLMVFSCKKTTHATNPTPANYRILSYSEVINGVYPANVYTFSYDAQNRVSQIIFTTSDSNIVKYGAGVGTRSVFYYSNDSIFKYNSVLQTGIATDTNIFILNTSKQIITAYVPASSDESATKKATQYTYYGKLLSSVSDKYYHGATSLSASRNYTSNNGDFLALNFGGQLNAAFSSAYTPPTALTYATGFTKDVIHGSITSTDVLTNYMDVPTTLYVADAATHMDTVVFPGGVQQFEKYTVFPDKDNRPGDYLQIRSFTMYGANIYQQAHLTKSILNPLSQTNITYEIDADSKITTTTATILDSAGHTSTAAYRFQYETF